ncbi:MAG: spondin domain-containing protein [Pseudomonadota bacterium]
MSNCSSLKGPESNAIFLSLALAVSLFCPSLVSANDQQSTYEIELDIQWTQDRMPYEYPLQAHMSGLIGLTHNTRFSLFQDGDTASSGLELVAENGRSGILRAQFEELERRDRIGAIIDGKGLKNVPGTISARFETTRSHPLLSVVTMLAPSPDWFTGVSAVNLLKDDQWIDSIQQTLWVWDAGTDSGPTFTSKNADTQPRQSVRLLATPHFFNNNGLIGIGTIKIKRIDS